ncbi:MAG: 16S rRNA (adenine(1518)-N(6)/adenine(1519)-N(6))-dimethyltransferase RsmA [Dysgonamonadaceae bacterium]|jgi:16S rRNA (adenine1518-N6/adenine1519-N6)-dimethyltransferase|nr:16S rRNA (adenine(1518)-N(6)/adenine(1519)-N(6))-dimethyltransferase RsmA [Dysgonamonadaceae bacterium]
MQRNNIRPKKRLGQHFLTDEEIARRIAGLIPKDELPVLEIGPGTGVLTQYLTKVHQNIRMIEIDPRSVAYLHERFPEFRDRIMLGDFMELHLESLFGSQFALIGNYPYNLSNQIFFKLIEHKDLISVCAGMVQKEVADRISSLPGKKTYGITSVLLQMWYDVEYIFTVEPESFNPPPKVRSAVIRLIRNGRRSLPCSEEALKLVVKTAFNQRRKTLRNSLRQLISSKHGIFDHNFLSRRPEQLTVEDFIALTMLLT